MARLKGEVGASPTLSRNCNAHQPVSEARSPASVGNCHLLVVKVVMIQRDG
jgi:hypothetical protein